MSNIHKNTLYTLNLNISKEHLNAKHALLIFQLMSFRNSFFLICPRTWVTICLKFQTRFSGKNENKMNCMKCQHTMF